MNGHFMLQNHKKKIISPAYGSNTIRETIYIVYVTKFVLYIRYLTYHIKMAYH